LFSSVYRSFQGIPSLFVRRADNYYISFYT
jgi:hypothetical protein